MIRLIFDYDHWQALIYFYEMFLFIKQINIVENKKKLSFKLVLIIKSFRNYSLVPLHDFCVTLTTWNINEKKKTNNEKHERKYDYRSKSELFSDCVEHVVKQVIKFKRAKNKTKKKKKITENKIHAGRAFIVMIRGFVVVVKILSKIFLENIKFDVWMRLFIFFLFYCDT